MTNEYDRSRWIKTAGKYAEENVRLLTEIGRLEEELTEANQKVTNLVDQQIGLEDEIREAYETICELTDELEHAREDG